MCSYLSVLALDGQQWKPAAVKYTKSYHGPYTNPPHVQFVDVLIYMLIFHAIAQCGDCYV